MVGSTTGVECTEGRSVCGQPGVNQEGVERSSTRAPDNVIFEGVRHDFRNASPENAEFLALS